MEHFHAIILLTNNSSLPPSHCLGTWRISALSSTMHDPVKDPKYWRARAHATRAKAKQCYDGREIRRMLRVAEENDRMADRAQQWQRVREGHDE